MPHVSDILVRRLAAVTAAWGVVFAGFHFYWAAGGSVGIEGDAPSLAASLYIAFIAVLGLVGAAVAYGLEKGWGARSGRRRLRMLARLGGLVLLLGVAVGVGPWIAAGSLGDDGAAAVVITAYFLLGGLLFSTLGWVRTGRPGGTSPRMRESGRGRRFFVEPDGAAASPARRRDARSASAG